MIRDVHKRWWLACLLCVPLGAAAQLHHAFEVTLHPERHGLEVRDTVTLSGGASNSLIFALHPALTVETVTPGARLSEVPVKTAHRLPALNSASDRSAVQARHYRLELPPGQNRFTLHYSGPIQHALQQQGEEYARGFSETPGIISEQGVFLAASSYWYPHVGDELMTFELKVRLPPEWKGVTQGKRLAHETGPGKVHEHWRCDFPQEEVYLVAGRFTEYRQEEDGVLARVLLRDADPALAQKYLDATGYYIKLYSDLIGAYPYNQFALVENFWETGYGMPSFTLLGPKIIRFPFILHSSYPHEILHNWWGNGVYVDYQRGNWAEGLTSYLADHLIKEQRAQGVDYRRTALQKYTDYVRHQQDFPLSRFRSRHSATSEAVGYGKTLMLFHMLRRELGDDGFVEGLRRLYHDYRFRVADFDAVQEAFSTVAKQPLQAFFDQWVERRGAPALRVSKAGGKAQGGGYLLSAVIEQTQPEAPYTLQVPVAVQLEGRASAYQTDVKIERKRTRIELELPARPLTLDVDPEFDLFRRLHREELPPAISQAMGAERVLIVVPANAPPKLKAGYRRLAESWQAGNPDRIEINLDNKLESLPHDRAVWLFGWRNRFRPQLTRALSGYDYETRDNGIRIEQTSLLREQHAVVVMGRQLDHPDQALGWLAAENNAALPGLGRKLPHYGRYSYLAFTGDQPENTFKGRWPVLGSPMSVPVAQSDGVSIEPTAARLAPRKPLVEAPAKFSTTRMQRDMTYLANEAMQGRGLGTAALDRAATYIAGQFREAGLHPGGDGDGYLQVWREPVAALEGEVVLQNVVGVLPGSDPRRSTESLVIGAHYDHLGRGETAAHAADRGRIHPGADDNASGVAVLLETARALAGKQPPRSIVFVAFTGEESGRLGSRHYVRKASRYPQERMLAMLNLDTVGRLGNNPLTLFGTGTAEEWPHIFRGASYVTGVAVRNVADDFGSSDQTSFIEAGVPAVQLFGGVHADIHRPGDTLDKLDVDGLVKVARVLAEAVDYLAGRPEALRSTLGGRQRIAEAPAQAQRRVSLGTVPDFTFQDGGVRIDEVRSGTPAEQAGLRSGDIIIAVNDAPVRDLKQYAQALRRLNPGDRIRVRFRRGDGEQTVDTRVVER